MMSTHKKIIKWMLANVDSYTSSTNMASDAIDRFNLPDSNWIWNTAQDVFDVRQTRNAQEKY